MPRHAPELECSTEDKASLVAITKSRIEEARVVERARIILACLDGKEIQQVAWELGVSIPTVAKWRRRFALWGLRGLGDRSRPGKPVKYDTAFRNRVLAVLEEAPPPGMSRWDGLAVAGKLDASVHAFWRVLRREGIYLQRRRSWCVSTDKEFGPKAADVVGLYLNPPLNAVVLSVDEKPSIQAIERASGYVETDSGKVVRGLKSTYKRHGTLNLFAALEVGTGQLRTKFTEFKKREDFRGFLDGVLTDQPQDAEIHVILDNYSPHKRNDDWLAKFEGRVRFHFTPTSASWLNQIEIVFSLLQRKTLNGGSFKTKDQLRDAIEAFFRRHNEHAKPFRWRKRDVKGSQLRNTVINLRKPRGKDARKPDPQDRTWEGATYRYEEEGPSVTAKGYANNKVTRIFNNKGTSMFEIHCPDSKDKAALPWVAMGDGVAPAKIILKDHKEQDKLVDAVKDFKLPKKP